MFMVVTKIVVSMRMPVVMCSVAMAMCSVEGEDANQVHQQPKGAHHKQLSGSTDIGSREQSLNGFIDNFNADKH